MLSGLDCDQAQVVVECGPGTGAFTSHILAELSPGATFLAIEINEACAEFLEKLHPGVAIHRTCVSELPELCRKAGVGAVDIVVSGLPWAAFPSSQQQRLLGAIHGSLRPGGRFVTFAYSHAAGFPPGRRFSALLGRTFAAVERSRTVWRNLPPAFVYRCRK
jgi:phospholipid N-methyltransferase